MIPQLIAIAALIFFICRVINFIRNVRKQKVLCNNVPTPVGKPVVGNLFQVNRSTVEMMERLVERSNRYAAQGHDISGFWIFHECFFTPNCGRSIKVLLDSTAEIVKGNTYEVARPWLGNGLLTSTGDIWRHHRRLLTPSFHFSQLDTYISVMNTNAKILTDDILFDRLGTTSTIDIFPLIKLCSLDILCEASMGKELSAQRNPSHPYVTALNEVMRLTLDIILMPHNWIKFVRVLNGKESELVRNANDARKFTRQVIMERSNALKKGEVEENKRAFLDLLLNLNGENELTEKEVQDEVETFMFAGHDTTTSAIAWTIWCLACHSEIQDRAAQEILEIFGSNVDGDAMREDLQKMTYLERCIKESLRLFPPVPLVMRQLQNDLVFDNYTLHKGSTVNISPMVIHRNDLKDKESQLEPHEKILMEITIYTDARTYDPDRFLPENSDKRHSHDFIPFSAGPRNCIGKNF